MKIDEEIKFLKEKLGTIEDTSPDYLPDEIKELKLLVLSIHGSIERSLEGLIVSRMREEAGAEELRLIRQGHPLSWLSTGEWYAPSAIFELMQQLSFPLKLKIVSRFDNEFPEGPSMRVNTRRNDFVHLKGLDLRQKYNFDTPEGKVEIRDLLRCLDEANQEINAYFEQRLSKNP